MGMKNLFAIIIVLTSIAGNAQASDSLDNYIFKKKAAAAQTELKSKYMVNKLRNLPEGVGYVVNTTAVVKTNAIANKAPTAAELDAIATAAGSNNRLAAQKTAKK